MGEEEGGEIEVGVDEAKGKTVFEAEAEVSKEGEEEGGKPVVGEREGGGRRVGLFFYGGGARFQD
eukprot:evm.model.NODE_41344_length_1652_cov_19.639830.1